MGPVWFAQVRGTHSTRAPAPPRRQVSEGSGRLLVVAVGQQSEWGKTMALVGEAGDEDTPLQEKLGDMAAAIGKVGAAAERLKRCSGCMMPGTMHAVCAPLQTAACATCHWPLAERR